ncbi:MAG: hypothetical protein LUD68_03440 [Rikenellaceae bacterium]|nr:hypothetical protein [Rikenellaceae bacterium]
MNIYQKRLHQLVQSLCPHDGPAVVDLLFRLGVIDSTLVKVLLIREHVRELMLAGESKLNAMWRATEIFACTYKYVRKCMYYYKDINLDQAENTVSTSV